MENIFEKYGLIVAKSKMIKPIYCVIATCQRPSLLKRTLLSIEASRKPENFKGVVVVENGPKSGAQSILQEYVRTLENHYFYLSQANKSLALNHIIGKFGDCLFYFIDDDMRLDPDAICAMAEAFSQIRGRCFLGGPLGVDYESPPPDWLLYYLPYSAKGWQLQASATMLCDSPWFLGGNWAAASGDLCKVGGFPEGIGPNALSGGEERAIQIELVNDGVSGYYVPQAKVWHYVPEERCSPRFALSKMYQRGCFDGLMLKKENKGIKYPMQLIAGIVVSCMRIPIPLVLQRRRRVFHLLFRVANRTGICHAYFQKKNLLKVNEKS
jgi:GT2 family glycosyltransferase